MKANRRCQILQKDYDVCKEAMTDFFIDDEDWRQWDKSAIVIEGNLLNIYYGKKDAFSKGHGHYAINLRSGSVIYHRSLNKPHGSQNYCNARPQTSNL